MSKGSIQVRPHSPLAELTSRAKDVDRKQTGARTWQDHKK